MQTHTTSTSSASRAAAPPAPPNTIPRGTPALLVGVGTGLGVDLGMARVLIMTSGWVVIAGLVLESGFAVTRGPEVVVTIVVITSGRVVVAGLAVVGLVVTL